MSRARSRRPAAVSIRITWPAPSRRAMAAWAVPTGPAPITTTESSRPTAMSLWPQIASDSGSAKVACSSERPSGMRNRFLSAICGYGDQFGVGALVVEAHQLALAAQVLVASERQSRQWPHQRVEMQWTWSPTAIPPAATSAAALRADLDQLAADLMAEHPRRRGSGGRRCRTCARRRRRSRARDLQQGRHRGGRRRPLTFTERHRGPAPPRSLPHRPLPIVFAHSRAESVSYPELSYNLEARGDRVHLHADEG